MAAPKRLFRRSSSGRSAACVPVIAEYLDADVTLVRLLWILLSIVPGGVIGGLIAYLVAWIIMPDAVDPVADASARRLTRSTIDHKIAGVCGGLAEYFNLDATVVRVVWAILAVVPGGIVLGIVGYLVAWFIMPKQPSPSTAPAATAA